MKIEGSEGELRVMAVLGVAVGRVIMTVTTEAMTVLVVRIWCSKGDCGGKR